MSWNKRAVIPAAGGAIVVGALAALIVGPSITAEAVSDNGSDFVLSGVSQPQSAGRAAVVDSITVSGGAASADCFAGAGIDSTGGIVVYAAPTATDTDRARIAALAPGVPVRFEDAQHSYAELVAVRDQIVNNPRLADALDWVTASIAADGSTVHITVKGNPVDAAYSLDLLFPGKTTVSAA